MEINEFKNLPNEEQPPPHLKQEVLATVRVARLIMEFSDLFSSRVGQTVEGLFKDSALGNSDPIEE